jgi:anti-sigma regulatory factor (Ser/Thr protein kinase)
MQTESITIRATYDDILLAGAHLRQMLTAHQVAEETIRSCETALSKLLKNIVDFAYSKDSQKLITISITYNNSGVYIETQDEGLPIESSVNKVIEARNLQPASAIEEQLPAQKDMLDEVWYEVDTGKNIWQLVKYL